LMLPLMLLLLLGYDSRRFESNAASWVRGVAMPILFLAWANLHMLFVVGLGLLGVYVALAVWESRRAGRAIPVDLLLIFGVSAVATLATPYGWRSYWFVLENARLDNTGQHINELKPLWTALGEPGAG